MDPARLHHYNEVRPGCGKHPKDERYAEVLFV